jgi:methyltransferase
MGIEGAWRAGAGVPSTGGPAWLPAGVLLFTASKALKYWAIGTLGPRWSFRVWILPGRGLVRSGPYEYVAHPNYIAVGGELLAAAMMVRAFVSGPAMMVLFGLALAARIRFENRVLAANATGGAFEASEGKR